MDVMLHIFACLREPSGDREPLKLCARDFYCVLVPRDGDASPAELRDTVDLSELYSRAKVRSRERPAERLGLGRKQARSTARAVKTASLQITCPNLSPGSPRAN